MIKTQTLKSGIRLVTEDIPYVKSAAVGVWVKAGAVDETAGNSGISHFIEHMMFKGTKNRSAKKIAEDVDSLGGQINAFTGKEATCYYIKSLSENLSAAIEILADMLQNSLMDEDEIKRESGVILEEMKMIEDSPDELAHDLIMEEVFKGQALGKSIIGTRESVSSLGRDDFIAYIKENYVSENIVISVAGNFDEAMVIDKIEEQFTKVSQEKKKRSSDSTAYKPSFVSKTKDIEQTHICLGKKGLALEDDRYYPMSVTNSILGGGMSSRLFQNIREQKGLAYSVYSMSSSFVDDGYFMVYAGVAADKLEEAVKGISEELNNLKTEGISKEELSMAKQQIKGNYTFSLENTSSRMFAIGKNELLLNRVYTPDEVIAEIDGVAMDDLNATIDLITDIHDFSAVTVSNNEYDIEKTIKEIN